jgi:hypothetical protein
VAREQTNFNIALNGWGCGSEYAVLVGILDVQPLKRVTIQLRDLKRAEHLTSLIQWMLSRLDFCKHVSELVIAFVGYLPSGRDGTVDPVVDIMKAVQWAGKIVIKDCNWSSSRDERYRAKLDELGGSIGAEVHDILQIADINRLTANV